ncbi:hypothetical protein [Streptomyces sp. NBC_01727]|uniref:hypothetical protein n=1 Tax=Streptomyces sp. NBC_01727 TaxID=2975924 RepID=UPI002E146157|nr:hypothetical protein OIE76_43175 [Streptomyces sp. NBC_01727]
MFTLRRTAATALITATAVAGTALITAPTASAASYKCKTSTKSVDDPSYSGPWADNWDFTVSICAMRSGGTVYSYAKIKWDGPVGMSVDDAGIFNAAYFRLWEAKSVSGTDPVVKSGNYYGIESRLENSTSNGNYNNSYTTPTISYKTGTKTYGDGRLMLEWADDGKGYQTHNFTASPVV